MPNKTIALIAATSLLCCGLFVLTFGLGLPFFFLFLPSLPLFSLGLGKHAQHALASVVGAALLIGIVTGPASAVVFFTLLGIPCWYIVSESMRFRHHTGTHSREWMPIGSVFLKLTLAACVFMAFIVLYYSLQPEGITAMLAKSIASSLAQLPDEFKEPALQELVIKLANQLSFLVFAGTFWMWALMLYGHAWLAHRSLHKRGLAPRHDFSVHLFPLPAWLLPLLGICALASIIGSPSMQFLGKSVLISLMFPYFLYGAALMHKASQKWPNRTILLFFIYVTVLSFCWPALVISGAGLWHQIKHLPPHKS